MYVEDAYLPDGTAVNSSLARSEAVKELTSQRSATAKTLCISGYSFS